MKTIKWFMVCSFLALAACKVQPEMSGSNETFNYDEDEMTTDSLVNGIDESIEDLTSGASTNTAQKIISDGCVNTSTTTSEIHLTFVDQLLAGTNIYVNGTVLRSYNNPVCGMNTVGDSLVREHDLLFSRLYSGATLESKSSEHSNYLGARIGGGEQLTRTAAGWNLEILGTNQKIIGPAGVERLNISVESTQPLIINGTLGRASRTLVSGQVKIYHNLAKYTATFTPTQLAWTSECKCPVSGTLEVDYEGAVNGGASIVFTSCGKATLTTDTGRTKNLNLRRCFAK